MRHRYSLCIQDTLKKEKTRKLMLPGFLIIVNLLPAFGLLFRRMQQPDVVSEVGAFEVNLFR